MLDDLKQAWRHLRNDLRFALTAVLTLGIAVGANAAIFMVADAVLLRPLPYDDPQRLFALRSVDEFGVASAAVPYEYIQSVQRHHTGVEAVALRSSPTMSRHAGPDGAEHMETFVAAPDYFRVLGVRPSLEYSHQASFFHPSPSPSATAPRDGSSSCSSRQRRPLTGTEKTPTQLSEPVSPWIRFSGCLAG